MKENRTGHEDRADDCQIRSCLSQMKPTYALQHEGLDNSASKEADDGHSTVCVELALAASEPIRTRTPV